MEIFWREEMGLFVHVSANVSPLSTESA